MRYSTVGTGSSTHRRQAGFETVFDIVWEEIITGDLPAGQRLFEGELAERLGVSRTPVREALRLLHGDGLVQRRSAGGYAVAALDATEMRNIGEVRAVLEGLAARRTATLITTEQLNALNALTEQMELLRAYPTTVAELGTQFHQQILAVADSATLASSLERIRAHVDRYRQLSTSSAGRPEEAVAEHRQIYAAIAAGDPDIAERSMCAHILRGSVIAVRRAFPDAQTEIPTLLKEG